MLSISLASELDVSTILSRSSEEDSWAEAWWEDQEKGGVGEEVEGYKYQLKVWQEN